MKEFDKKSLTSEEQLDLLISRGLNVEDYNSAVQILKRNGYYHLSSYMRMFQQGEEHNFVENIEFADIYRLSLFDKRLRFFVFNAIQQIELAYRAAISNILCKKGGSHWFYDYKYFKNQKEKTKILDLIKNQIHKSNNNKEYSETFIAKYYHKYDSPDLPPFWMAIETFTMGSLNILYNSLSGENKKEIIKYLGFVNDINFMAYKSNWLQAISVVRNICAHHSRLFNRVFRICPAKHKKIKEMNINNTSSFYYIAMIINYYLVTMNKDTSFEEIIKQLFKDCPDSYKIAMGFPLSWEKFNYTYENKTLKTLQS